MSIKPQALDATPDAVWRGAIQVDGRDAAAFLQAQLMNDLRPLGIGDWQWSGWLNAKGRLIALMIVLRQADSEFLLLLPDHAPAALAEQLRRYVFRSKVTLQVRDDWLLVGTWADAELSDDPDRVASLTLGGERARRLSIEPIGVRDHPGHINAAIWAVEDLAHGIPRLPETAIAAHTPQMLGLERLRAFSVKKGCYPGQEIVARTHFLGQAKRGLVRLQSEAALTAGTKLLREGSPVGEVLCTASEGARNEALAVLPLESERPPLFTPQGQAVSVTGFAEGLCR